MTDEEEKDLDFDKLIEQLVGGATLSGLEYLCDNYDVEVTINIKPKVKNMECSKYDDELKECPSGLCRYLIRRPGCKQRVHECSFLMS